MPRWFPRGVWDRCGWLQDQGVTRVEVRGRDRHHLDLDRDGVACERFD
ncbi:excalibur calcium-binding domain-containing protein [Saccharothrix sp. MB29]|nr:excalibur calcium-binding domain-containing protein [Saccharothrix sp. MB29]